MYTDRPKKEFIIISIAMLIFSLPMALLPLTIERLTKLWNIENYKLFFAGLIISTVYHILAFLLSVLCLFLKNNLKILKFSLHIQRILFVVLFSILITLQFFFIAVVPSLVMLCFLYSRTKKIIKDEEEIREVFEIKKETNDEKEN